MSLHATKARGIMAVACRTVLYSAEGRTVCLVRDKPCLYHASLVFSVSVSTESSAKQRHSLESSSDLIVTCTLGFGN